MDAETRQQLNDLIELREHHQNRLRVLRVQAAKFGISTPPEIETEISDIERKIAEIDAKFVQFYIAELRKPEISTSNAAFVADNSRSNDVNITRLIEDDIRNQVNGIYKLLYGWLDIDGTARNQRQRRTDTYTFVTIGLLVVITLILLFK